MHGTMKSYKIFPYEYIILLYNVVYGIPPVRALE